MLYTGALLSFALACGGCLVISALKHGIRNLF